MFANFERRNLGAPVQTDGWTHRQPCFWRCSDGLDNLSVMFFDSAPHPAASVYSTQPVDLLIVPADVRTCKQACRLQDCAWKKLHFNPMETYNAELRIFLIAHVSCVRRTLCLKIVSKFKLSVTLSNLSRFSNFLHCWNAYEICYKTHATLPIRWVMLHGFISYAFHRCKKFENRLRFDKVT